VDICPSLVDANRPRVQAALDELRAEIVPTGKSRTTSEAADRQPVLEFSSVAGSVKVGGTPAGVPRGYDALRSGATIEHLGGGLRPSVAATADLITMAAARGLPKDIALVPQLQRILQLEASPARILETPAPGMSCRRRRFNRPGVSSEVRSLDDPRPHLTPPPVPSYMRHLGLWTQTRFNGGSLWFASPCRPGFRQPGPVAQTLRRPHLYRQGSLADEDGLRPPQRQPGKAAVSVRGTH
jgi:hypothetical protein